MRKGWQAGLVLVTLGVVASAPVARAADPARSMADLESRMKPGTQVQVVDRQGGFISGAFVRADGEGVLIARWGAAGGRRVPAADVATVSREGDSLKNGALIGAGAAAALMIAATANQPTGPGGPSCLLDDSVCQVGIVALLGFSVGAGVLIDRMNTGREVVYRAPDHVAWSIVPYPVRRGAGVGVALRF